MDQLSIIILLYVIGLLLLVLEVFIPSHGLLTVGALVCLGFAVAGTFARDTTAGIIGVAACAITIPTVFFLGIKYIRYLPMGHRLAPPNPAAGQTGPAFDPTDYQAYMGKVGRAVTALRPAGICEFAGRRVQCVAEAGIIDPGTHVVGVEMHLNNLVVRPVEPLET